MPCCLTPNPEQQLFPADLKLYTRKVEVTRDKIPSWPHDRLTVMAEQSSVFYDLMTPELVEQVLVLILAG